MIHYRSEEEIDLIRESSLLVAKTHAEISALIKPGVTTLQLDTIAEEFIRDNGGVPAFKGYSGFPNTLCASLNAQVVHGIPNDKLLNDGDIISMDCGVVMNGYYGDSAYTYGVGNVSEEVKNLLIRTKESLYKGIEKAVSGNRIGDIGFVIKSCELDTHTEKIYTFTVRILQFKFQGLDYDNVICPIWFSRPGLFWFVLKLTDYPPLGPQLRYGMVLQ